MRTITFLLLLITSFASAQTSSLYNKKRQLIADMSLQIDQYTYLNIKPIETELLSRLYNTIVYPAVAKEDGRSGVVVAKISITNGEVEFAIERSTNKVFNEPVIRALSIVFPNVTVFPRTGKLLFYLPVKFDLIQDSYKKTMKKDHMVTIQTNDIAPVSTFISH